MNEISRLGRWMLVLAGAVVAVALVGAAWHEVATVLMERNHPMPGKLVTVGQHRLHVQQHGVGALPVVIEADWGGASYDWDAVASELGKVTLTVTYDRAGYGWSDAGPSPRSSVIEVRELRELLDKARVPRPFILVGHGWGGLNARLYASKHPDEVAALVLVDSLNLDLLPPDAAIGKVSWWWHVGRATAGIGAARVVVPWKLQEPHDNRAALERRQAMLVRTKTAQAMCEERISMAQWMSLRGALKPLGDKPLLVIARRLPESLSPSDPRAQAEAEWQKEQTALQDLSGRSRWVTANVALPDLQYHDRDLLVTEVQRLHALLVSMGVGKVAGGTPAPAN